MRRPARRALAGVLAGAAGTLAMDAYQFRGERRRGAASRFADWELSSRQVASFDDGGAPAEIGRRAAEQVGVQIPDRRAGVTQDVVHWSTGVGWGLVAVAVAGGGSARRGLRAGLVTGVAAFATSYAVLGSLGIYEPIWRYDRESLARDLAGHLVYGATTGAGLAGVAGLRRFGPG
ncbi:MAG: hypothetical protein R2761_29395 [Acidimicrobiales bacterium]